MKLTLIIILSVVLSGNIYTQVDTTSIPVQLDILLEDSIIDTDDSQIYDSIEYLIDNPIDINKATVKELTRIPLLNYSTALIIIRERNLIGGFTTIEQIKKIKDLPTDEIEKILPFIKIETSKNLLNSFDEYLHQIKFSYRFRTVNDLQTREGFTNDKFLGTKPKLYNRFQLRSKDKFCAGFLMEKDAGEKNLTDFTSFHLNIIKIEELLDFTIGDYTFEFGQGLSLWGPYSFSKGSNATSSVNKNGRGLIPYLSADENQFMRGGGVRINFGNIAFSSFLSSKFLDASIDSNTQKITSLVIDGYHRTQNEIGKKDNVKETIFGISTDFYLSEEHKMSFLYCQMKYQNDFAGTERYKPYGNKFEYYSLAYSTIINRMFLSGEFAYNNTSIASINNIEFVVSKNLSLIFSFRNYPRNFISLHGKSFGEKDNAQNEAGVYSGLFWRSPWGSINIYYDQYKIPYTSSKYSLSSYGNEFLAYYEKIFSKSFQLRLRYKFGEKDFLGTINDEYLLIKQKKHSFRTEVNYKASSYLQIKTRLEYTNLPKNLFSQFEDGLLIFQDVRYSPLKLLTLQTRIILFRSDSYNSRIYEYENDLPGVMTNPPLYGEGMRWYFIVNYKSNFGLIISLKYSELYKPNEKILGTSFSIIDGNLDNRLSLQIDYTVF